MTESESILIVDDEASIADLVAELLGAEGFRTQICYSGAEALAAFAQGTFDLVILDIMMPGMDGFEVCRKLRAVSDVPIVFLSARDEETDQVIGLTLGADDYVPKPFRPRELVVRVKARLRRAKQPAQPAGHNVLEARGIVVDRTAHTATLHDAPLKLTPKEFDVLALLIEHEGAPVSVADIFEHVWKERYDSAAGNSVMVHIRHLRKKLADIDASQEFIVTVWGVGYKIDGNALEEGR